MTKTKITEVDKLAALIAKYDNVKGKTKKDLFNAGWFLQDLHDDIENGDYDLSKEEKDWALVRINTVINNIRKAGA